jgi:hypothetical protein
MPQKKGNKKMTYTLYVGNGYRDTSRNTSQGMKDVAVCAAVIGHKCYIKFASGQMEQVLDDLVCVSYVDTLEGVQQTVDALRGAGVAGGIRVFVDYEGERPERELYTV